MKRYMTILACLAFGVSLSLDVFLLVSTSNEELIKACGQYSDVYSIKMYLLPDTATCLSLIHVRDPDPNEMVSSEWRERSLFTYMLNFHVKHGSANEAQSRMVLERFLKKGIKRRPNEDEIYTRLLDDAKRNDRPDHVRLIKRARGEVE